MLASPPRRTARSSSPCPAIRPSASARSALLELAARLLAVTVEVLPAVSALDAIADAPRRRSARGRGPIHRRRSTSPRLVDAEPFAAGRLAIDPARPCLVGQVYTPTGGRRQAGPRPPLSGRPSVTVVTAAGVRRPRNASPAALCTQLDRQPVDHLTSVWVPPLPPLGRTARRNPAAGRRPPARPRTAAPGTASKPSQSLRDAVIEEAYEVVDAIDAGDADNLAEELGDLLLQVALHSPDRRGSGHLPARGCLRADAIIPNARKFARPKLIR